MHINQEYDKKSRLSNLETAINDNLAVLQQTTNYKDAEVTL